MPKKSVLIIGPNKFLYNAMYQRFGFDISDDPWTADLYQFTGGADVTPKLYGHAKHHSTASNPYRDKAEMILFNWGRERDIPMAGICRGGQFLNVMCGGTMWQDVDNHGVSHGHQAFDLTTKEEFRVSSTHHQMMICGKEGYPVLISSESTKKTKALPDGNFTSVYDQTPNDMEAIFYPAEDCFCFQPHPEFSEYKELAERYEYYLNHYLLSDDWMNDIEAE